MYGSDRRRIIITRTEAVLSRRLLALRIASTVDYLSLGIALSDFMTETPHICQSLVVLLVCCATSSHQSSILCITPYLTMPPPRLPPFASAENIALDNALQKKEQRLATLQQTCADLAQRKERMQKHYKQTDNEFKQTQQLLEMKKGEVQREMQRREIGEREKGRLNTMKQEAKTNMQELEKQVRSSNRYH